MSRLLPLWSLCGCYGWGVSLECDPEQVSSTDEFYYGSAHGGWAPWDPIYVDRDDVEEEGGENGTLVPVIGGEQAWALEPLLDPPLVTEASGLFRLLEEPVDTTLVAVGIWAGVDQPVFELDEDDCAGPELTRWTPLGDRWDVGHHGRTSDFEPESVLGRWVVNPDMLFIGGELGWGGLVEQYLDLTVEFLAIEEGSVEFRIVSHDQGSCVVLHDVGQLSATGEFTWSKERIEAETEPAPLVIYEPRLRLGFDGSDHAAGGEASAIVDVRASEGGELDVCQQLGDACEPCPDDGHESCLPLAAYYWRAYRGEEPVAGDLPYCGFDFSDTGVVPDFDCGWDGTLCAFASFISVAPLLRKRRRDER